MLLKNSPRKAVAASSEDHDSGTFCLLVSSSWSLLLCRPLCSLLGGLLFNRRSLVVQLARQCSRDSWRLASPASKKFWVGRPLAANTRERMPTPRPHARSARSALRTATNPCISALPGLTTASRGWQFNAALPPAGHRPEGCLAAALTTALCPCAGCAV